MSRKILLSVVILCLALLYAWSRIKVVELGYDVSKAKGEIAEMMRENGLLKSQVAQAKSTARLADWAKRLGMASPGADQVLSIGEDR